jgi:RHS repeat-associated protein
VWQWDGLDPFGAGAASGTIDYPLRYPGQYYDAETGLHYNYFRDYDPTIGRYIQSDPIGLDGGISTYLYAHGSPTTRTDPLGLKTFMCMKPLNLLGGEGARSGPDIWGNPLYHQYSCIIDKSGRVMCGGQDRGEDGAGKPSNDRMGAGQCKETQPDNDCFEKCLIDEWKKPRPNYGIPFGTDCQEYDDDVNRHCRKQCKLK